MFIHEAIDVFLQHFTENAGEGDWEGSNDFEVHPVDLGIDAIMASFQAPAVRNSAQTDG